MTRAFPPADVFRMLSDPTRLALFERLAREGELTVSELTAGAGVSQPAVSQHLEKLKLVGLVQDRREGRLAHYSADPTGLAPLTDWLAFYSQFWTERFDKLEAFLEHMDQ